MWALVIIFMFLLFGFVCYKQGFKEGKEVGVEIGVAVHFTRNNN